MIEAREAAIERIEAKRRFREEIAKYVVVNGFFIVLWALGGGGSFWPAIILIGWGLHLAICLVRLYNRPISENEITRELERSGVDRGVAR